MSKEFYKCKGTPTRIVGHFSEDFLLHQTNQSATLVHSLASKTCYKHTRNSVTVINHFYVIHIYVTTDVWDYYCSDHDEVICVIKC